MFKKKYKHKAGDTCSRCHKGKLRVIEGKFGIFFGCSNYPNCRYICKLVGSNFSAYGKVANWRLDNKNDTHKPSKVVSYFA